MKFFLIFVSLLFSTSIFAGYPPMPERCPSPEMIRLIGLMKSNKMPYTDNEWFAEQPMSYFNTQELWSFSINNISAVTADEALELATKDLKSLKVSYGPEEIIDDGRWICIYSTLHYRAAAVTPPYDHL